MRYRVEELAERCAISVDTVRFYQSRGLLPRPEREGRVVWYSGAHIERLERIRDLKQRGFPLSLIARLVSGELDASEEALALALAGPLADENAVTAAQDSLTLDDLAARTGASRTLLEALEREGLLIGRGDEERPYTVEDAGAVEAGLILLQAGVPLSELLALAREHDEAMRAIADHSVDLFARYIRDPLQQSQDPAAPRRMVAALEAMLPAADAIVRHHFRRRLIAAASARIAEEGAPSGALEADESMGRRLG